MIMEDKRINSLNDANIEVIIPENTTTIGKKVFSNNTNIEKITIPSFVKTVSDNAFMNCSNLKSVIFEDGIRRFGDYAFAECISLKCIYMPDSVVSLHKGVFKNCCNLEKVVLSENLKRNIASSSFSGCSKLESIVIPSGINRICSRAFSNCTSLKNVVFENGDIMIDYDAFENCDMLSDDVRLFIKNHVVEKNIIDIKSKAKGEIGRLSNFTKRHFFFDGVECNSIEGVLQSFKCPDASQQKEICMLDGKNAKAAGLEFDWTVNQILYWNGTEYSRKGEEYQKLLDRLYDAVYEQDAQFRADLQFIKDKKFDHKMGLTDKSKTVLTRSEFVQRLRKRSGY